MRKPNGKHAVSYESLLTFIDGDGDVRRIGITRSDDVVLFPAPPGPIENTTKTRNHNTAMYYICATGIPRGKKFAGTNP